jgi:hypothetical protein
MMPKLISAGVSIAAVPLVAIALPFLAPQSFATPPPAAPAQPAQGALSPGQVAALAYAAGFRGQALVIAVAITGAESSMVPTVVGDQYPIKGCWCDSTGLWQIRSCPADDPTVNYSTAGCHPPLNRGTRAYLQVPANNATVAYRLASSFASGFDNWSTYTNGAYLAWMSQAQAAAAPYAGGAQ